MELLDKSMNDCNQCNDWKLSSKSCVVVDKLTNCQIRHFDQKFYVTHCKTTEDIPIDQNYFAKTLGLIARNKLANESKEELNLTFPLRQIARTVPKVSQGSDILCWTQEKSENEKKLNAKKTKKKRMSKKTVINVRKPCTAVTKKQFKRLIGNFPIGSQLFDKFKAKFDQTLIASNDMKVEDISIQVPEYSCKEDLLKSSSPQKYNNWNVSDIEKKCHRSELSVRMCDKEKRSKKSKVRNEDQFIHWITFSRRQRLEKMSRLTTGLNWRLRLKASHCQKLNVELKRLNVFKCWECCQSFHESSLCQHLMSKQTDYIDNTENDFIDCQPINNSMTPLDNSTPSVTEHKSVDTEIETKELSDVTKRWIRNEDLFCRPLRPQ